MAQFKNGPIQKWPDSKMDHFKWSISKMTQFKYGSIQIKMVILTVRISLLNIEKKFIVRGSLTFKNILNLYIQHFISDLARRKKKDSVETLNELEGDFSAALFHRSRIILS